MLAQLRETTVPGTSGGRPTAIPLALVGRPVVRAVPGMLRAEEHGLAAYLLVDLDPGADLAAFVQRADRALTQAREPGRLQLRPGERLDWIGQYPLLVAGERRLLWIAPLVLLTMVALLYLQFRSLAETLIVLASVPFALVGSIWTLHWLGYPLSPPVWVGLLSVTGLAMQTGVVMVVYIDDAFRRRLAEGRLRTREDIVEAHAEGTVRRLRPKLMTICTMGAGLLPLLWADGADGAKSRPSYARTCGWAGGCRSIGGSGGRGTAAAPWPSRGRPTRAVPTIDAIGTPSASARRSWRWRQIV